MFDIEDIIETQLSTPTPPPPEPTSPRAITPRDWDNLNEDDWRREHDRIFVGPPPPIRVEGLPDPQPEKATVIDMGNDPDYTLPTLFGGPALNRLMDECRARIEREWASRKALVKG